MNKLEKLIHDIDSTKTDYLDKKEILKRLLEIKNYDTKATRK